MNSPDAFIAAHRFGLGARPEEEQAIAANPRRWVADQIGRADPAVHALFADLPDTAGAVEIFQQTRDAMRAGSNDDEEDGAGRFRRRSRRRMMSPLADLYLDETSVRLEAAMTSMTPFTERLVHFWSNHFTVSGVKAPLRLLAGAYEREAIRPNVYGNFADLVMASARHPAMLFYLDNVQSVGPNSRAGRWTGRGLNENYARELLELHTLGVNGGYSQEDVIALAEILTGWTIQRRRRRFIGAFDFESRIHEPGTKTLLGRRYGPAGEAEGEAAIRDLATHPSTARFIAEKLARHFVADDPPAAVFGRLEAAFLDSGGDLPTVYRALIDSPEAWRDPLSKAKTPNELLTAMGRSFAVESTERRMTVALREMGQTPFMAPSPQGWPDRADAWIGPQSLLNRVSVIHYLAEGLPRDIDVNALAERAIGAVAHPDTLLWISRAPDSVTGLSLLFASAEFQGR